MRPRIDCDYGPSPHQGGSMLAGLGIVALLIWALITFINGGHYA